jgi:hypothetical protein
MKVDSRSVDSTHTGDRSNKGGTTATVVAAADTGGACVVAGTGAAGAADRDSKTPVTSWFPAWITITVIPGTSGVLSLHSSITLASVIPCKETSMLRCCLAAHSSRAFFALMYALERTFAPPPPPAPPSSWQPASTPIRTASAAPAIAAPTVDFVESRRLMAPNSAPFGSLGWAAASTDSNSWFTVLPSTLWRLGWSASTDSSRQTSSG